MKLVFWAGLWTFLLDQATKWLVVHALNLRTLGEIDVVPPLLNFRMAWNRGVNFGLFQGDGDTGRWVLIGVAVAIICFVLVWIWREPPGKWGMISAGLLIGGAIGNVVDRLLYGAVADFLNMSCCGIENPFAFNVADVAIFAGALGLVLFPGPRSKTAEKTGEKGPVTLGKQSDMADVTTIRRVAMTGPRIWMLLGTMTVLAACGDSERDITLHDLRSNRGTPEEFAIEPKKPLLAPQNFAELPVPTPGSTNRTDQTPRLDAVAALGGNPARMVPTDAVPGSDVALVSHASRLGRDGSIRTQLAAEDLEFRKRKSRFSWRLFTEDEYDRAYSNQSLDAYGTLNASRQAGARTPAAPPEGR